MDFIHVGNIHEASSDRRWFRNMVPATADWDSWPEVFQAPRARAMEISLAEYLVLSTTRGNKPGYGGDKNYRFNELNRELTPQFPPTPVRERMPKEVYDEASELLKLKKLLNKRGAITPSGRKVQEKIAIEVLDGYSGLNYAYKDAYDRFFG